MIQDIKNSDGSVSTLKYLKRYIGSEAIVHLPNQVTVMRRAFENNCTITKLIIPPVIDIDEEAFTNCNNLQSIFCENGVVNSLTIGDSAFQSCKSLKEIEFPVEGYVKIGEDAFSGCENLRELDLPKSIFSVGEGAFSLCFNLNKIEVEGDNTQIADDCFKYCNRINTLL